MRKQNTHFCCCCCFCAWILFDEGSGVDTGSLLYPVFDHEGLILLILRIDFRYVQNYIRDQFICLFRATEKKGKIKAKVHMHINGKSMQKY